MTELEEGNKLDAEKNAQEVDCDSENESPEKSTGEKTHLVEHAEISLPSGISISLSSNHFRVDQLIYFISEFYKQITGESFQGLKNQEQKNKDKEENKKGENYLG
ncbi:hypothetical protein GOV12_02290 [Candidatus Pacearchaeota archaeon]|nr:hypothetical protein [Candidatus Pacearchaeota archaeon]